MESDKKIGKRIQELTSEILKYDDYYYRKNTPLLSDAEYDTLRRELDVLEKNYPQYVLPTSPNNRVGTPISSQKTTTIRYKVPMLSIANVWNTQEVMDFDRSRKSLLGKGTIGYVCEPKYDGLSCSLVYENGILVRGGTRGDGYQGENITTNVRVISSIPNKLQTQQPPEMVEVRGEVVIFKEDFKELNQKQRRDKKPLFANPRNAAAGSLQQLDPKVTAERNLHFMGWGIGQLKGWSPQTQTEVLQQLKLWGFEVDAHHRSCLSINDAITFYKDTDQIRERFPFEIDGTVIKIDRLAYQLELGTTAHAPRWAIAYKFEAKQITTILKDITVQIGRSGVVTPVALLEPVMLGGAQICKASLHTFDIIKQKDLRIGDRVIVERAGDVIPEVTAAIIEARTGKEQIYKVPVSCPVCGTPLLKKGAYLYCTNYYCPEQFIARLEHLVSREAFDIKGLGKSNLRQLVGLQLVKDEADIFYLNKEDLQKLPLWGAKKTEKLLKEIDKKKTITFSKFINALSIPGIGITAARTLASYFGNLDKLVGATKAELTSVAHIGTKAATSIVEFFSKTENKALIQKLLASGISIQYEST